MLHKFTNGRSRANGGSAVHHSTYRSPRAVLPPKSRQGSFYSQRFKSRFANACIFISGVGLFLTTILIPFLIISEGDLGDSSSSNHTSVHSIKRLWEQGKEGSLDSEKSLVKNINNDNISSTKKQTKNEQKFIISDSSKERINRKGHKVTLNELYKKPSRRRPSSLARGESGLSLSQTPALVGAQRGRINCDVNVDFLAYWNDPIGDEDANFLSPFASMATDGQEKYVTFEPDKGGWNNLRISLENIVVFAVATGRTIVLPPESPLYLLTKEVDGKKVHSYSDFFPFQSDSFKKNGNLKIISFEDFLDRESNMRFPLEENEREGIKQAKSSCTMREKNSDACHPIFNYLRRIGFIINGDHFSDEHCFIFDEEILRKSSTSANVTHLEAMIDANKQNRIKSFCGDREVVFYDQAIEDEPLIHFPTNQNSHRLLIHFYVFFHFTDANIDNHFKRYIRDFLHYHDKIYCIAGKIVLALQEETKGMSLYQNQIDEEGGGGFSSMHVRRGDFQWEKVRIKAEEWYENTKDLFEDQKELIYIATDERNKTFFNPLRDHYQLRFLDDYWDMVDSDIDPNYMGMVDTIVASRGNTFVGTWFSSFSGYINRMRGYHGMPMKKSFYGTLNRKYKLHELDYFPKGGLVAREFPIGWVGIDGNEFAGGYDGFKALAFNTSIEKNQSILNSSLARGISGLPISETPALIGASRGRIECDIDVGSLAYWNHPQGTRDRNFQSPFLGLEAEQPKYLTFVPDRGGWNNIRMNLEIIFIFAAATGRTLVLPPDAPLYLMRADKGRKHRGLGDFIPLDKDWFQERVKIISTEEFLKREAGAHGRFPLPESTRESILKAASACDKRKKSVIPCFPLIEYLTEVGTELDVNGNSCIIFDEEKFQGKKMLKHIDDRVRQFCNWTSPDNIYYYNSTVQNESLIHFNNDKGNRILAHFYGALLFTNPIINNYYKRFVRDFLHYHDEIYCAAGKIVLTIQADGKKRGFKPNEEGGGGYSSMHVRRGDLQYKKVKISAEEWYNNLKETWEPNEIIFIATDERNKTFFDPIAKKHDVRFLDDYWDLAGLGELDPNFMGMIDTIVASRGRVFAGTFFSTFSGYINRMRGYHGMSMKDSYYGWLPRKNVTHEWKQDISGKTFGFEWPTGWIGIDGDKIQSKNKF